MRFFSVSSQPFTCDRARVCRESAEYFGIPVEVKVIDNFDWHGKNVHPHIVAYLKNLARDEIVLGTDLWDACFLAGASCIEAAFLAAETPILFSVEPGHNHHNGYYGPWEPTPTRWNAINGGGWMGRAGALLAMLEDLRFWEGSEVNQAAYRKWFMRNKSAAKLDYQCRVFQCLWACPGNALDIRHERIYNTETETYPCLLHGNGGLAGWVAELWRRFLNDDRVARIRRERGHEEIRSITAV